MSLMGRHTLGFLDWATGRSLLVFDVDKRIGTVDTAGTEARTFADANPRDKYWSNDWVYSYHADVSPDGSMIVYASCEFPFPHSGYGYPPGYELAIVNVDGTGLQRLTIDGRFTAYPAWSPDGSRIAFIRTEAYFNYDDPRYYHPFNSQIAILSDKGTKRVPGTKGVGMYPPVWSPDGGRLAFLVNQPAEGEKDPYRPTNPYTHILFQIRPDDSAGNRLGEATTLPSWSPDGERLAFGLEDEVYTVRLDGTDRRLVVDDLRANQVSWSPDGTELLLASDDGVYVVGADGSGLRKLGPSNLGVKSAIWSSDGSTIAARHELDDESLVFVMNRDGTDVRFLAEARLWIAEEEVCRSTIPRACASAYPDVVTCEADHFFGGDESNPGLIVDCLTLLAVWREFGPEMLDWDLGAPIAEWSGVGVEGLPHRVRKLVLENLGLTGPIPTDIASLTKLEVLDLSGNDLTGPIPRELDELANLKVLDLSHNDLSGRITYDLVELVNLQELDLSHNGLTGRISNNLGRLTMLKELDLGNNGLSGPIPAGLRGLEMLESLDLSANDLSGSIPQELGKLTALKSLRLHDNSLSGCVPVELPDLWINASGLERCKPEGGDGS